MKLLPALALLLFALDSCGSPMPLAADPDTAAYLAEGTLQAAATAQQGTRAEWERQAAAAAQATQDAVQSTQAAVYATQAAATATAQTREAATAAAATVTADAYSTRAAIVAMQTRDAGWEATRRTALETQATATAMAGAAEQDRQERTRGALWGWLGLLTVAGFVGGGLYTLYSYAYRRVAQARIIRNDRTGAPVALWVGRGMWELIEPEPIPALPAPNGDGDYEPPSIVRVNGARRETLYQYDDDLALHWRDMHIVLSQEQIRQLRRWHGEGHTRIRRDSSSAGPGVDQLPPPPLASGSTYNTLRAVLLGLEYIDESGAWTALGASEFLGVQPVPPSSRPRRRRRLDYGPRPTA